jgi:hypothetical protein
LSSHPESGYYVYLLINPITNKIFYVGKGKGKRSFAHYVEYKKGSVTNALKFHYIDQIISAGKEVEVKYFAVNLDEPTAFKIESYLISELKTYGLANIQNGTATNEQKQEVKANSLLNRVMPFERWIGIKPRNDKQVGYYHKIVETLKQIANG